MFLRFVGGVVVFCAAIALLAIIDGYVLVHLWGWFVAPTFDLPELSLTIAIGISLTASYLLGGVGNLPKPTDDFDPDGMFKEFLWNALAPFVVLFVGWLTHMFL